MVGTPAATFYYVSSPRHLGFQPRLSQTLRMLSNILRQLIFQALPPQVLPHFGYNPRHLVFKPRLPQALPRLVTIRVNLFYYQVFLSYAPG